MNRKQLMQIVALVVMPVMLALGFVKQAHQPEAKKVANTMRTYYVQADGKISARKPETFTKTVRAQNVTHARRIMAA